MKKIVSFATAVIIGMQLISVSAAEGEQSVYVSADGSDAAAGTLAAPCKSLKRAGEIAKAKIDEGAERIYIKIHSGNYFADETAVLPSGTVCEPYGDGDVVFTGAKTLAREGFKAVEDSNVLSLVPIEAAKNLLEYDLSADGFAFSVSDEFLPYLFADGEEQSESRYPNGGYLTADSADGSAVFSAGERAKRWTNAKDAYVCGSLDATYFWRIKKVKDISEENIELSGGIRKNSAWCITNLLEEIDTAKEYFVDRNTQKLYFYPAHDFSKAEIVSSDADVINIDNTNNVTIRGIKFEKLGGRAISAKNCSGINIENCEFLYVQGDYAIEFDGKNSDVKNNAAYGCDGGLIHFEGGDLKTLEPGNVIIDNNRVTYCGRKSFSNVIYSGNSNYGMLTSCGNTVKNNVISDCMTFSAIGGKGNNYLIENNEIYNNGWLMDDAGAIYYGKSNIQYGNVIRNNYVHDLNRDNSYCGIYSDDGFSGITVVNNVVRNAQKGIIINYGMNCDISDNLFVNTDIGITGGSMMGKSTGKNLYTETYNALNKTVYKDAFKKAYPEMEKSLSRKPFWAPWNTKLVGNVQVGGAKSVISDRPWHLLDENTEDLSEEELNEKNALTYNSGGYVGSVWKSGTKVDELKAYGASVTNDSGVELNGTAEGNPVYAYNDSYFSDAAAQDYTPSANLSTEYSDFSGIDMSVVGTNGEMITKNAESMSAAYPKDEKVLNENVHFVWDSCPNVSQYRIVVSQNSNLSNPEIDEKFVETSSDRCVIGTLQENKTYYWCVYAYGIGKNNEFELQSPIVSFESVGKDENEAENLKFLLDLCEKKLVKIKNGELVCPGDLAESLKSEYERVKNASGAVLSAEESVKLQESLYDVLKKVDTADGTGAKITRCEAAENTSQVFVEAQGFMPNTKVSVMVTNPGYGALDAAENIDLARIQYIRTLTADSQGKISFDFDTVVRGNDMPGKYTLYLTDEKGQRYSENFIYGTIEVGEIVISDKDGNIPENIWETDEIYLSCDIVNRSGILLNPYIINAFYGGKKLVNVKSSGDTSISPDEKKNISWRITTKGMSDIDEVKVIFVDSPITLKPLTTERVIYSIK